MPKKKRLCDATHPALAHAEESPTKEKPSTASILQKNNTPDSTSKKNSSLKSNNGKSLTKKRRRKFGHLPDSVWSPSGESDEELASSISKKNKYSLGSRLSTLSIPKKKNATILTAKKISSIKSNTLKGGQKARLFAKRRNGLIVATSKKNSSEHTPQKKVPRVVKNSPRPGMTPANNPSSKPSSVGKTVENSPQSAADATAKDSLSSPVGSTAKDSQSSPVGETAKDSVSLLAGNSPSAEDLLNVNVDDHGLFTKPKTNRGKYFLLCRFCKRKRLDRPSRLQIHEQKCKRQREMFYEIVEELKGKKLKIAARVCFSCKIGFQNASHLRRHNRTIHGDAYYQESARLESKNFFAKKKRQTRKTYPCRYCRKNCYRQERVPIHENLCTKRARFQDTSLQCRFCFKVYCSVEYHARHEEWCQNKQPGKPAHKCDICEKAFINANLLQNHKAWHSKKIPLSCRFCDMKFNKKGDLKKHERTHSSDKPFACKHCSETFAKRNACKNHEKTHKCNILQCEVCAKTFSNPNYMKVHLRQHTGEKPYRCTICLESFMTKGMRSTHMKSHGMLKCRLCNSTFDHDQQEKLDIHISNIHGEGCLTGNVKQERQSPNLPCGVDPSRAEDVFTTKSPELEGAKLKKGGGESKDSDTLEDGTNSIQCTNPQDGQGESKQDKDADDRCGDLVPIGDKSSEMKDQDKETATCCQFCSKTYSSVQYLKRHEEWCQNKGIDEKTALKCDICDKLFINASTLQNHKAWHSDKVPSSCGFCNLKFSKKSDLKKHERTHSSDTPFACKHCLETFADRDECKSHERKHRSLLYQCEVCAKLFSNQSYVKVHMRHHTGETPFKCDLCSKSFISSAKRDRHVKKHSMLMCELCERTFDQQEKLDKHISKAHGDNKTVKQERISPNLPSGVDPSRAEDVFTTKSPGEKLKKGGRKKKKGEDETNNVHTNAVSQDGELRDDGGADDTRNEGDDFVKEGDDGMQYEEDYDGQENEGSFYKEEELDDAGIEYKVSTADAISETDERVGQESTEESSTASESEVSTVRRRSSGEMLAHDLANLPNASYDNFDVPTEVLVNYGHVVPDPEPSFVLQQSRDEDPDASFVLEHGGGHHDHASDVDHADCEACLDDEDHEEDCGECEACQNEMKPMVQAKVYQYIASVAKGCLKMDQELRHELQLSSTDGEDNDSAMETNSTVTEASKIDTDSEITFKIYSKITTDGDANSTNDDVQGEIEMEVFQDDSAGDFSETDAIEFTKEAVRKVIERAAKEVTGGGTIEFTEGFFTDSATDEVAEEGANEFTEGACEVTESATDEVAEEGANVSTEERAYEVTEDVSELIEGLSELTKETASDFNEPSFSEITGEFLGTISEAAKEVTEECTGKVSEDVSKLTDGTHELTEETVHEVTKEDEIIKGANVVTEGAKVVDDGIEEQVEEITKNENEDKERCEETTDGEDTKEDGKEGGRCDDGGHEDINENNGDNSGGHDQNEGYSDANQAHGGDDANSNDDHDGNEERNDDDDDDDEAYDGANEDTGTEEEGEEDDEDEQFDSLIEDKNANVINGAKNFTMNHAEGVELDTAEEFSQSGDQKQFVSTGMITDELPEGVYMDATNISGDDANFVKEQIEQTDVLQSLKDLCENYEELSSGDEEFSSDTRRKTQETISEIIQKETEFLEHFESDHSNRVDSTDSEAVTVDKTRNNAVNGFNNATSTLSDSSKSSSVGNKNGVRGRPKTSHNGLVKKGRPKNALKVTNAKGAKKFIAKKTRIRRTNLIMCQYCKGNFDSQFIRSHRAICTDKPRPGVHEDNVSDPKNNVIVPKNNVTVPKNNVSVPKNSVSVTQNAQPIIKRRGKTPMHDQSMKTCQYCHIHLPQLERLKLHETKCCELKKKFGYLEKHPEAIQKAFKEGKTFMCPFCIKDCKSRQRFEQHWRLCQQRKRRIEQVRMGLDVAAEFTCNYCVRCFLNERDWAKHEVECKKIGQQYEAIMQMSAPKPVYDCIKCNKKFPKKQMWARHNSQCMVGLTSVIGPKKRGRPVQSKTLPSSTESIVRLVSGKPVQLKPPSTSDPPDLSQSNVLKRLSMDLEFEYVSPDLASPNHSLRSTNPPVMKDSPSQTSPSPAKSLVNKNEDTKTHQQKRKRTLDIEGKSPNHKRMKNMFNGSPTTSPIKKTSPKRSSLQMKSLELKRKSVKQQQQVAAAAMPVKKTSFRCRYCSEFCYNIERLIVHERRCLFVKDYSELPSQLRNHFGLAFL